MQLAELDDMLNSPSTSAEMLKMAEDEKLAVLKRTEIEETVGSILRAIGFEGAAACFESGCVTVMIYADEPTVEEVARITELILDSVDVSAGDIKIIPIN